MDINRSIAKTLIKENGQYHEASKCTDCKPNTKVRRGVWLAENKLKNAEKIGIPVYYDEKNVLMLPFSHALVTGSSGTGKTEVIYKNLLKLLGDLPPELLPSMMITDLKGDLSQDIYGYLIHKGYRVIVLDMRNSYGSARYNFLSQIYDDYHEALQIQQALREKKIRREFDGVTYRSIEVARAAAKAKRLELLDFVDQSIAEVAHIIITVNDPKDKTWVDGARTMLKAIIWTMLRDSERSESQMTRETFTIANVCRIAFSTGDDCEEIVEWMERAKDILCVQNAITSNYQLKAKVTRDGYVSSLNTPLGEYTSNAIGSITATSDEIDLRKIAKSDQPYAVFVITDDRRKTTNNICMMFMNNLINELVEAADRSPGHALKRDFIILADEFANMPPMPNLSHKITTLRSRKIWMIMAIQSIQQLEMVYGRETSEIIQDNCDLHLFIGCNNDTTKEAFARSMGKTIGVKTSFHLSNDGSLSVAKSTEDVPVIRKSDLDELQLGEFYVRSRQCQNFKSYMTPYFMQPNIDQWRIETKMDFREFDPNANKYDIFEVLKKENAGDSYHRFFD